ncbi:MAG: type II toxin-antitoxin system HicA family toxin, partial [Limisphaerales bacterium]
MSRLPVCSGQDAIRPFQKLGYEVDHQTGSHIILRHPQMRRLTVPDHRELVWCPRNSYTFVAPHLDSGAARRGSMSAWTCDRGATKPEPK